MIPVISVYKIKFKGLNHKSVSNEASYKLSIENLAQLSSPCTSVRKETKISPGLHKAVY